MRIYLPPEHLPSDNHLFDIYKPKKEAEAAPASENDAYHNGPPEKPKSKQKQGEKDEEPHDRPLITYAYSESDFGRKNLQFFVDHGLHDAADFVFILNGETDVKNVVIPKGRSNIKVIERDNTCFDLGAHYTVLTQKEDGGKPLKDRYKRFILMNASIRGPFVPHWSKECWSDAYLGRLNDKVKVYFSSALVMTCTDAYKSSLDLHSTATPATLLTCNP